MADRGAATLLTPAVLTGDDLVRPARQLTASSRIVRQSDSFYSTAPSGGVTHQLDAASAGVATTAGEVGPERGLTASSSGTGDASAVFDVTAHLSSGMVGSGDVGSVLVGGAAGVGVSEFGARADGRSTVQAALDVATGGVTQELAGAIAGTSAVSAELAVTRPLTGVSAGAAAASAGLGLARPLVAVSVGTSVVTADALVTRPLTASSAGAATASGALEVTGAGSTTGSSAGSSSAAGDVQLVRGLAASVLGQATCSVAMPELLRGLRVTVDGVASTIAQLSVDVVPKIGLRVAAARVDFR